MKRRTGSALLTLVVLVSVVSVAGVGQTAAAAATDTQCSFPFSKVDATGTEVTVEQEPQEVVTLNPSAAQTMWEIGAKGKVTGVSKFALYLDGASEKTNISGAGRTTVVAEKVVALQPDLVLAPNTIPNGTVETLRESGLTVYKFQPAGSVQDVVDKTRLTGELVGECEGAEERATWMEEQLSIIRDAVEGQDRPKVLYTFSGGYTAGNGTFIHMAIETAGGTNVAAEAGISGYKPISEETIVEQNPDWIIRNTYQPEVPENSAYNGTTAVEQGNVLVIDTNLINQPAPRIIYPIRKMVKSFHPEAYNESLRTPTPPPTESPAAGTDTATGTEEIATGTATDTSTGVPGMGVLVTLVALAGAALLARRR